MGVAHFYYLFILVFFLSLSRNRYVLPVAYLSLLPAGSPSFGQITGSIQVAPMATLRLGPTFKADSIKEGDDVYFECSIQANPDVTRLVWKHEVSRHT